MDKPRVCTPHFWRKVRYSYMDARGHTNAEEKSVDSFLTIP
jgi:hypothetical protein